MERTAGPDVWAVPTAPQARSEAGPVRSRDSGLGRSGVLFGITHPLSAEKDCPSVVSAPTRQPSGVSQHSLKPYGILGPLQKPLRRRRYLRLWTTGLQAWTNRVTAWNSRSTVREEWSGCVSWSSCQKSWASPTNDSSSSFAPSDRISAVNSCTHLSPKTCFCVLPCSRTVKRHRLRSRTPGSRWFPANRGCRRSPCVRPRARLGSSHPRCSRR